MLNCVILASFASVTCFVGEGVEICQCDLSSFRNRIVQYFNLCVTSFVNILRWVGWVWYVFLSTRRDLNPAPVGEESIALSTELKDNPKLWQ